MRLIPEAAVRILRNAMDTLRYYFRGLLTCFIEDDILFLASGIAFNVLLCFIPLLLLISSIVGSLLNSSDIAFRSIDDLVARALANQPHALPVRNLVMRILNDLVALRQSLGLFGLIVLAYTSTSLFSSLRSALHRVYRVASSPGIFISQLKDIGLVLVIGFLFILVNGINWIFNIFVQYGQIVLGFDFLVLMPWLPTYLPPITSLILTVLMAFVAYRFIPFYGSTTRSALISALTTTMLWEIAGRIFSWYLTTFTPFTRLYGAYAFILVTMVWVYYSSVVFVLGGAVGGLYKVRRER